jgi:hypothetical protein
MSGACELEAGRAELQDDPDLPKYFADFFAAGFASGKQ